MKLNNWLTVSAAFAAFAPSALASSFVGVGDIAGGEFGSFVSGVSSDGSVVVGSSYYRSRAGEDLLEAFRWTRNGGLQRLGRLPGDEISKAAAVSGDGSVIVGESEVDAVVFGLNGPQALAQLGGFSDPFAQAFGVSGDGSVIVGAGFGQSDRGFGYQAIQWVNGTAVGYGALPGPFFFSLANAASENGSVVVGAVNQGNVLRAFRAEPGKPGFTFNLIVPGASTANDVSDDGTVVVGAVDFGAGSEPFVWNARGIDYIGDLPGGDLNGAALAISGDGSTVVGYGTDASGSYATIWRGREGLRKLQDVLTTEFRLNLDGWTLTEATGISQNGRVIVGNGFNPQGKEEGWVAVLERPRAVIGDTDNSGCVDDADLTNIILDFGGFGGETSGFPGSDINGDDIVDDADLTELILNFGGGC